MKWAPKDESGAAEPVPELRQDPFTRDWVLIAPRRALRPHRTPEPAAEPQDSATDPDCPFCPGNEDRTPGEVWRSAGEGWSVRVVPNRFPLLAARPGLTRRRLGGPFITADGTGSHEVVIESPHHDLDLPDLDDAAVTAVFDAYRDRSRALRDTWPGGLVLPFRNHGTAAGTSLRHPHSQIAALPVVPPRHRQRLDIARAYHDDRGSSLHTDVTTAELADGTRVVAELDQVVALAPFASTAPYAVRVLPRENEASFADVSDATLAATARTVRRLLAALRALLGDVPYNYLVLSAPCGAERAERFSWHLDVLPRLTTTAGFELGTGIAVNPVPPEYAAARLRGALGASRPQGADSRPA
ncbi:galactose-1-phosphate uridylyltransferase [Glycomyces sp. NPDC049804]|uniref:galactose-1-phosphate uridylyltransferase n=1 Tax=Glycomyces sp. NPDC049804 TaxID=3154363 RepID=UPI003423700D